MQFNTTIIISLQIQCDEVHIKSKKLSLLLSEDWCTVLEAKEQLPSFDPWSTQNVWKSMSGSLSSTKKSWWSSVQILYDWSNLVCIKGRILLLNTSLSSLRWILRSSQCIFTYTRQMCARSTVAWNLSVVVLDCFDDILYLNRNRVIWFWAACAKCFDNNMI